MSYDIGLNDKNGERIFFDEPLELWGGIVAVDPKTGDLVGDKEAYLNVTYNYSQIFYLVFGSEGIHVLEGLLGMESIPILDKAIAALGNDPVDEDYWKATLGNARKALEDLRELAKLAPGGIWEIS